MGNPERYVEAEAELREILAIARRPEVLGEEHRFTLRCEYWLAKMLKDMEKYQEASELALYIEPLYRKALPSEHPWSQELAALIQQLSEI